MKYRFGDNTDAAVSRAQKIRSLFISGVTIKTHTEKCIDANLWSESELRSRAARQCRAEVRDALGTLVDGLPFAGPTASRENRAARDEDEGPAPVWKQIELWSEEDFLYNYKCKASLGGQNIAVANNIAVECNRRYGRSLKLLRIVEIEDEPL